MPLVLQIAQYEAVALEVKKLLLVLFWTVFRIMRPGRHLELTWRRSGPEFVNSVFAINLLFLQKFISRN